METSGGIASLSSEGRRREGRRRRLIGEDELAAAGLEAGEAVEEGHAKQIDAEAVAGDDERLDVVAP